MVTKKSELGPGNNPGRARWCESHRRLECTKNRTKRQGGGPCHAAAIKGTNVCRNHGGYRTDVLKAKGEARITAWNALGPVDSEDRVEPSMAVLGMLQMAWLRAAAYGELLHRQVVNQASDEPDHEGLEGGDASGKTSGLIGYRYGAAGKEGHIYAVNEEVRALVPLESAERDRVVRFAKTAHDMGISERLINLAEKWGDVVAGRITLILAGLELSPEQERKVPGLIHTHLSNIDVTSGS